MDYHSGAYVTAIVKPNDHATATGVYADPSERRSLVGTAYPHSHVGGMKVTGDPWADYPPPEVVWRLVIDRAWAGGKILHLDDKLILDGRFVLRSGRFVELGEDAE